MASLAADAAESKAPAAAGSSGDAAAEPEGPHPLQTGWSLWEHRENTDGSWSANFHKLCDFDTVEDFWKYWNHIPKPR